GLRRLCPVPVLWIAATGAVLTSVQSPVPWVEVAAVGLASFTVGEHSGDSTRSALVVLAVTSIMAVGFLAQDARPIEGLVLPLVILVPTWFVGDVVRGRRIEAQRRVEAL